MGCHMTRDEIENAEAEVNKARLGSALPDRRIVQEVACDAVSVLRRLGKLHEASQLTQKWAGWHDVLDRAREREEADRQSDREEADRREYERLRKKFSIDNAW